MQDRADGIVWTGTGWDSVGQRGEVQRFEHFLIFKRFQKQIFGKISPFFSPDK